MKRSSSSLLWLVSLLQGPNISIYYQNRPTTLVNAFSTRLQKSPRRLRSGLGRRSLHSSHLSSAPQASSTPANDYLDPNFFLNQVETTVEKVFSQFPDHLNNNKKAQKEFLLTLDGPQRESFGVAQNLHPRLSSLRRNQDCPRCWMQRAHCICEKTPPLSQDVLPQLNRIFLVMHHKEIALKVDTAKLILAAFPNQCRLVVAGIGPEYQASMKELQEATTNKNCLVLFPDDQAQSMQEILEHDYGPELLESNTNSDASSYQPYDLIVLDGTWAQARKIHTKYIPPMEQGGPRRVQLSESAVESLQQANDQSGHQLRRHTVAWRQVGTYEATRLFLKDLEEALPRETFDSTAENDMVPVWKQISNYQSIANEAARRELGPPRESQKGHS